MATFKMITAAAAAAKFARQAAHAAQKGEAAYKSGKAAFWSFGNAPKPTLAEIRGLLANMEALAVATQTAKVTAEVAKTLLTEETVVAAAAAKTQYNKLPSLYVRPLPKMTAEAVLQGWLNSVSEAGQVDTAEEAPVRAAAGLAVHLTELAEIARLGLEQNSAYGTAIVHAAKLRMWALENRSENAQGIEDQLVHLDQQGELAISARNALAFLLTAPSTKGSNVVVQGLATRSFYIGGRGSWTMRISLAADRVTSMPLSVFIRYMAVTEQLIAVKEVGELYNNMAPVLKAVYAQMAGVEIAGLEANKKAVIPLIASSAARTMVVGKGLWGAKATPEQCQARAGLEKAGFVPFYSAEGFEKHGYLIHKDSFKGVDNLFMKEVKGQLYSCEPASSAIVRLDKNAKGEGSKGQAIKVKMVVVSAQKDQMSAATMHALVSSFGIGCGGFNASAYGKNGVVRMVGSMIAGQKLVVGDADEVVFPTILKALKDKGIVTLTDDTVICGLSSVKSKHAKSMLAWTPVTLADGGVIQVATLQDCDAFITESGACLAFEMVPQEEVGLSAYLTSSELRLVTSGTPAKKDRDVLNTVYDYMHGMKCGMAKALTDLEAFETLRRKSYAAKLNMQMLSAMHTQYGAEQVEKYLAGLFSSSKGRKAQAEIRMITSLITGAIPANSVHTVELDGEEGLVNFFRGLLEEKAALDRPVSSTHHGDVLGGLVYFLNEAGKDWTRISYAGQAVMIPSGMLLAKGLSATNKGTILKASGLLAELIKALHFAATTEYKLTDTVFSNTMSEIIKARDMNLGKSLAQVQSYGSAGLIVSGCTVQYGQFMSPLLEAIAEQAGLGYRTKVGFVWYKSPTIMAASVSPVMMIHSNLTENQALLQGTAIYANALFVLAKQDDGDGDKTTIAILPRWALLKGKLGAHAFKNAARPTDETVNPAATALNEWMSEELEGLFCESIKPAPLKHITWQEYTSAVVSAAEARGNVGLFTSAQQTAQAKRDVVVDAITSALVKGGVVPRTQMARLGIKRLPAIANELKAEYIADLIADAMALVQGHATQTDSMDRIKRDTSAVHLMLAKTLSPRTLSSLRPATTVEEAEVIVGFSKNLQSKTEGLVGEALLAEVKKLQTACFAQVASDVVGMSGKYQLNFNEMPVGKALVAEYGPMSTDALTNVILLLGVIGNAAAGYAAATTTDLLEVVFGNDNKVSSLFFGDVHAENVLSTVGNIHAYPNAQAMLLAAVLA